MTKRIRHPRGPAKWAFPCSFLLLAACSQLPRDASLAVNDPNEKVNRKVMAMNQTALEPVSEFIKAAVPGPVHDRLHDLNSNLKEPRIFVNDVLQGRFKAAADTSGRFIINSVFGLGGLFDLASRSGLPQRSGDFGQTLFVWGVAEGPYVMQPYLGPATLRDAFGSVVDMVANPMSWALGPALTAATATTTDSANMVVSVTTEGVDAVDRLGQLKMAEDASIDFYSLVRSSYYQTRRAELREALGLPAVVDSPALEDPDDDAAPTTVPAPATRTASAPASRAARHVPALAPAHTVAGTAPASRAARHVPAPAPAHTVAGTAPASRAARHVPAPAPAGAVSATASAPDGSDTASATAENRTVSASP
jgi:phospholipid-binding lipoprotein MlaA